MYQYLNANPPRATAIQIIRDTYLFGHVLRAGRRAFFPGGRLAGKITKVKSIMSVRPYKLFSSFARGAFSLATNLACSKMKQTFPFIYLFTVAS